MEYDQHVRVCDIAVSERGGWSPDIELHFKRERDDKPDAIWDFPGV